MCVLRKKILYYASSILHKVNTANHSIDEYIETEGCAKETVPTCSLLSLSSANGA